MTFCQLTSICLSALAFSACAPASEEAATVVVDATKRHQTIDGFGTCLISWEPKMAEWYRKPESVRLYADELRFNILRCNMWGDGTIGPTDPERIDYRDPAFAKEDPRTPVFIDFAKAVRAINPNLRVIGTVWSPPAWMKANRSIVDVESGAIDGRSYEVDRNGAKRAATNRVLPQYYPHFANWLAEMARHYEVNGVPIYALSAANEPQFTQSFESCIWTAKDLATITGMTYDVLQRKGLGRIRMFGPETMTGFNWENGPNHLYTQAMRDDSNAWSALGFWATHGYSDGVVADVSKNSSAMFWSIVESDRKPYWITEGGTGGHAWPKPVKEGGVGMAIHNAFVAGNASAFVPWQFAESGDSEHALTQLTGLDKKGNVVRHYSRYIPAGSVRIDALPAYGVVEASAFLHGQDVTVVLLNPSDTAKAVRVVLKGLVPNALNEVRTSASEDSLVLPPLKAANGAFTVTVPGPGIVTLTTLR